MGKASHQLRSGYSPATLRHCTSVSEGFPFLRQRHRYCSCPESSPRHCMLVVHHMRQHVLASWRPAAPGESILRRCDPVVRCRGERAIFCLCLVSSCDPPAKSSRTLVLSQKHQSVVEHETGNVSVRCVVEEARKAENAKLPDKGRMTPGQVIHMVHA